jgi:hypothetical protein
LPSTAPGVQGKGAAGAAAAAAAAAVGVTSERPAGAQAAAAVEEPAGNSSNSSSSGGSSKSKVCAGCGQMFPKLRKCAGCAAAGVYTGYCSEVCQKAAWPMHKKECRGRGKQQQ